MTLSDTQSSILRQAAQHPDRLAAPPTRLPPSARISIARALLNAGFVARAESTDTSTSWKLDGEPAWLAITDIGRHAVGAIAECPPTEPAQERSTQDQAGVAGEPVNSPRVSTGASGSHPRPKLRDAVTALLTCWNGTTEREPLADAVAALQAATGPARRAVSPTRASRQGTKQEAVLALLRRPEGATIANVVEATGWAQHTVRGFFAGLKKKGHSVEVLDRVRQNGPNNAGAKGSYSVYRLAEAG